MVHMMLHAIEDELRILQVRRGEFAAFLFPCLDMLLWILCDVFEAWSDMFFRASASK